MTEIAASADQPCPACGGARVPVGVRTEIDGQELTLWRRSRRGWGIRDLTKVSALACIGCGLVTFHVADLAGLQADVAKHPELFRRHE